MWETAGFESNSLKDLVEKTAAFHFLFGVHHFPDEEWLVEITPCGNAPVSEEGLRQFNKAVNDRLEELDY